MAGITGWLAARSDAGEVLKHQLPRKSLSVQWSPLVAPDGSLPTDVGTLFPCPTYNWSDAFEEGDQWVRTAFLVGEMTLPQDGYNSFTARDNTVSFTPALWVSHVRPELEKFHHLWKEFVLMEQQGCTIVPGENGEGGPPAYVATEL